MLREVILTGKSIVDAGSIPLAEAGSAGRAVPPETFQPGLTVDSLVDHVGKV